MIQPAAAWTTGHVVSDLVLQRPAAFSFSMPHAASGRTYIYASSRLRERVRARARPHTHTHTRARARARTHTHTHAYTHSYIYARLCTRAHIGANK